MTRQSPRGLPSFCRSRRRRRRGRPEPARATGSSPETPRVSPSGRTRCADIEESTVRHSGHRSQIASNFSIGSSACSTAAAAGVPRCSSRVRPSICPRCIPLSANSRKWTKAQALLSNWEERLGLRPLPAVRGQRNTPRANRWPDPAAAARHARGCRSGTGARADRKVQRDLAGLWPLCRTVNLSISAQRVRPDGETRGVSGEEPVARAGTGRPRRLLRRDRQNEGSPRGRFPSHCVSKRMPRQRAEKRRSLFDVSGQRAGARPSYEKAIAAGLETHCITGARC